MEDWEDAILIRQESEADECATCPHKGEKCRNQCMEIINVYNPYLILPHNYYLGGDEVIEDA